MDYSVQLDWKPGTQEGTARTEGKPAIAISAPPEMGGNGDCWSPEHLIVSSLQSCLMLTTLYFVKRGNIELKQYASSATGTMTKSPEGLRFTEIAVAIDAKLANSDDEVKFSEAVHLAEKFCPVSAALNVPITLAIETSCD